MKHPHVPALLGLGLALSAVVAHAAPKAVQPATPALALVPHIIILDGPDLMARPSAARTVEHDAAGRLTVVLTDTPSVFVYGVAIPGDGGPARVCKRVGRARAAAAPGGGAGKCKFDNLDATATIQVLAVPMAADGEDKPKIKYGPVITIKPKG